MTTTPIPNTEIFGRLKLSQAEAAKEYAAGYEAGKVAAGKVAVGSLFRGAFGFADIYAGSTKACRESPAWKGACNGYCDQLGLYNAITVDKNGIVISIEELG